MLAQKTQSSPKSYLWKIFFGFNVIVLFFFWFGVFTDYEWAYGWLSLAFSTLSLVSSLALVFMVRHWGKLKRFLIILVALISFLIATLTFLFNSAARNGSGRALLETALSPDKTRVVELYCLSNMAHGGTDHIDIKVKSVKFPFLMRHMGAYANYPTRNCKFDEPPVRWEDNNTIYVVEKQALITVGIIKGEVVLFNPGVLDGTD
jgi:hypothetical protein